MTVLLLIIYLAYIARVICTTCKNDHIFIDVVKEAANLDPPLKADQIKLIDDSITSTKLKDRKILAKAKETKFDIDAHTLYRYFKSAEFKETYHGLAYDDALIETINWRSEFGVHKISYKAVEECVKKGIAYTSTSRDKFGRTIMYFKLGRNIKLSDQNIYLQFLMYTIERAEKMSVASGQGEFIAIVDMEGLGMTNSPPLQVVKSGMSLMKKHYPYRLSGIFIVNANFAFMTIWNIIKPLVPKRALSKTFVVSKGEQKALFEEKIGLKFLEAAYGGDAKEELSIGDPVLYYKSGFWNK